MKLWDKGGNTHEKIDFFTVGNDRALDQFLAAYDIKASIAHAEMLATVGLLEAEEADHLVTALTQINKEITAGTFKIEADFEDVHSKIEFLLTERLGDVGKKIHAARSRNDQVLVAMQLFLKDQIQEIKTGSQDLFNLLISLADKHAGLILPGYTHLQVAMPSSFGLWFSSYAESLVDDVYFLEAAHKVCDQNPLGSAAGYGSSFPINRKMTTEKLGFSTLKYNVVAAQMGRGKTEKAMAFGMSAVAATLGKLAMDICLYMSQDLNFISFPDQLTTGSSIMPHKKNPDVFELIRGKCNKIQALHTEMLLITNNLPSGYHRDFQLLKENIINAFEDVKDILDILNYAIQQIIVKDIDLSDEKYQYLFTVDSINNLVVDGLSFREAYQKIGDQVQKGTYKPDMDKQHSHIGSIHNLCLEKVRDKFPE